MVAHALFHHCNHTPDALVNLIISIELNLLKYTHRLQKVSKGPEFYVLYRFVVVHYYSMCLNENLVCCINC